VKKLAWVFELFDKFSRPAKTIARHLDEIDRKMRTATGTGRRFDEGTRKMGDGFRKAGDSLGWFGLKLTGWIYAAKAAASVLGGIVGLPLGFARAGVEAAGMMETRRLSFGAMLGSPGAAAGIMRQADRSARAAGVPLDQMLERYQMLTAAGFRGQDLTNVVAAASDLGVVGGPQRADSIVRALTQIRAKGRLSAEELMQQLAEAGLNASLVLGNIGQRTGLDRTGVMKAMAAGRISSDLGISAILQVVQDTISGGPLGSLAAQYGKSSAGMLATLQSAPLRLFADLDKSAGMASLRKVLQNLVNVLDPDTPAGARIKKNVTDLFDRLLGGILRRFEDPKAVEAWINALLVGFERLIPKIGEIADRLGAVAAHAATIGRVLGVVTSPIGTMKAAGAAFDGAGAVETGESGEAIGHLRRLYRKGRLGPIEADELRMWERKAGQLGIPLEPLRREASQKPLGMTIQKGAFQFQINGAQDPKAVADAVSEQLSSVFEGLAMSAGAA
jgi:tape measure domain-containing protein